MQDNLCGTTINLFIGNFQQMERIKLSPHAKIFYIDWLLDQNSNRYNMVIDQVLYGEIEVSRLKKAFERYIKEHFILNSHIENIDGETYWVRNTSIAELEYLDSNISRADLAIYTSNSFNLHDGPLYRFRLIRLSENIYRLVIVLHHIVIDGLSADEGLYEKVSNYYNNSNYTSQYSIQEQIKLINELSTNFIERFELEGEKSKIFWRNQLEDAQIINLRFLELNTKNNQTDLEDDFDCIGEISFNFNELELDKLNLIKRKFLITPYLYGQCIFAVLLNRYSSQESFAISFPIAIREGQEFIYGAQVNTNLIPYKFSDNTTILDLFTQIRSFFKSLKQDGVNHSYYPITNIVQGNKDLLKVSFIQANFKGKSFDFEGVNKVEVQNEFNIDLFSPLLFEYNLSNPLEYRVRYDAKVIDKQLLELFISNYKELFIEILDDISIDEAKIKLISDYNILSKKEYYQTVHEWNQTKREYHSDKSVIEIFEEQVTRTPNNLAVMYENDRLTYKALNEKANQLANYLIKNYNISADTLIVLYTEKNYNLIIAILAILKAGGAYVPLDYTLPIERIRYIIKDTSAELVITSEVYRDRLNFVNVSNLIVIDNRSFQNSLKEEPTASPSVIISSKNLAYVIYTSGTSGAPKGVMIEHRSIINFIEALPFENNKPLNAAFIAPHVFDVSIFDIWSNLCVGHALFIISSDSLKRSSEFKAFLFIHKINKLYLPASLLKAYSNILSESNCITQLLIGVEPVFEKDITSLTNIKQIVNGYGPTETTVCSTLYIVDINNISYSKIPIGKPLANTSCYVLNSHLKPLPIGAIGELHIGGDGLARGYLNLPELTNEKFILNPLLNEKEKYLTSDSKLYKTGDLVRWLPDGNLEYIGRNDLQVKISGYRVELSEIEKVLESYPKIKQAVVISKPYNNSSSNDMVLIAYYTASHKLDEVQIYHYLSLRLPNYLMPNTVIYLEELPLTVRGKVNRKALYELEAINVKTYVAPTNYQEEIICNAFSKILGLNKVGLNDDFFKIGGNSIKAITLTSLLQKNFDVNVADIFNLRTPKNLAQSKQFGTNILKKKLRLIKNLYNKASSVALNSNTQYKIDAYINKVKNLSLTLPQIKPIKNVLLTGATGFLGCNILKELLLTTSYTINLIIRASSQEEAIIRINQKYQFYFNTSLQVNYKERINILVGDLENNYLGLSPQQYHNLVSRIDSIIHCAGLVKHYGEYDKFYSSNVKATINMLELSKLTKLKDFHYISTCSLIKYAPPLENGASAYSEEDDIVKLQCNNVYLKTKLLAEQEIINYRKLGVNANIYRVGNLAFMSNNGHPQENLNDNAFCSWLKCLLTIKRIAKEFNLVEISPVDLTAKAIVKLFDKSLTINEIFHIFNPYLFDITSALNNKCKDFLNIKTLDMDRFIDCICKYLNDNTKYDLIVRFLLHQGWLDDGIIEHSNLVLQDKTEKTLESLGFLWEPISVNTFVNYTKEIYFKVF